MVEEERSKKELELNSKKSKVMFVSRNNECPQINIFFIGNKLKQRDQFTYLSTSISSDGHNDTEIASSIAQTKNNFERMKLILTNNILFQTERRALEYYIEPILMYGCGAWIISKQVQKKLEATEMWFLWRMLQISWIACKEIKQNRVTRSQHKNIHK